MKMVKRTLQFAFFFLCATVMLSETAFAYLDPATTSYIIQIVAGVVIACGAAVGIFWKKIRLFFRNRKIARMEKRLAKEGEKREAAKTENGKAE